MVLGRSLKETNPETLKGCHLFSLSCVCVCVCVSVCLSIRELESTAFDLGT